MTLPQHSTFRSVMTFISISLVSIIAISVLTVFTSYRMIDLARSDAEAINLSGSMRMQTYRLEALLALGQTDDLSLLLEELDNTWQHKHFAAARLGLDSEAMNRSFAEAIKHWRETLRPKVEGALHAKSSSTTQVVAHSLFQTQVQLTDAMVKQLQLEAEMKIRSLSYVQLSGLVGVLLAGILIFGLLVLRIKRPLQGLSRAAIEVESGNYQHRITSIKEDELGFLSRAFNQMSESIQRSHAALEARVLQRTNQLEQKNTALNFLFNNSRSILQHSQVLEPEAMLQDLSQILDAASLKLCLLAPDANKSYRQIHQQSKDCEHSNCEACKHQAELNSNSVDEPKESYLIKQGEIEFGILTLSANDAEKLQEWQRTLLLSFADQLAIAFSLEEHTKQQGRLAMLNERGVIARELHDSLAQALSYLKIQVRRLQVNHDKQAYEKQQAVIDELHEHVAGAYTQLRELLSTFRLKMDENGLKIAIETATQDMHARSNMHIYTHYYLDDVPLSPFEEVHILHIIREACQNAIKHSKGDKIELALCQAADKSIEISISDDGGGMQQQFKQGHYGMDSLKERCHQLHAELQIDSDARGTRVQFSFLPAYVRKDSIIAQS